MPKLITASSFMLFWVFYEMSGGTDFAPRERVVVSQAPFSTPATRDTVAAPLVTNASFTPVETEALPAAMPVSMAIATPAPVEVVEEPAIAETPAALEVPKIDLVIVAGTRVNFRDGPGTNHAILDTLTQGTKAELVLVNDDGWAQIRLSDGQTGWMAERLLSEG